MTIVISPVHTNADKHAFYDFAWRVYHEDARWVPHLWPQYKAYLDKKAAFFSYGEGEFWLAKRDSEVVGTIGTAINQSRNRDRNERVAIFGFFEVLPDCYAVAQAMWDHACQWARGRGMVAVQGPYSFAMNDSPGFLVEGFEYSPAPMMGHNPPYYAEFAERYGFTPIQTSLAYRYDFANINFDVNNGPAIIHRIAARARQRHGSAAIRSPRMKDWDAEIPRLHAVYNKSLAVLPEFSPLELTEFRAQAEALRPIIDPELVFIAEVDGKTVGFGLGFPNIMEAFEVADGLRYPWDYLRFALARRKIASASFKILAIDPEYWGYGLEVIMFLEMGKALIRKGYQWADASLTNELNPQTNKLAQRLGAYVYRRYREYRLEL